MYTEFYGLTGEPFLLTPDHHFYFDSTVHSQAMAHLTYGLSRGEGFIVITGEVGAGKTTLVKHLLSTIDGEKVIVAHVVTTLLAGSELLRLVAAAFGIKDIPVDKGSMLLRLQRFFESTYKSGRRALLIVDEAQNLSIETLEELRMLSNFQVGNQAPFQSFLVGQPQFRDIIADPALEQLRQRVIASYHLGPMSRDECGDYLPHRLKHVGWHNDPAFEQSAVDAVYDHTGGIPRQINTLCNRLLLLGFLDNLHRFTGDDVNKVAADLRAENAARGKSDVAPYYGSGGYEGRSVASTDLEHRVQELEKRFSRQDKSLRQIASAFYELLGLSRPDSQSRS
ncbi:MAG: AAA family ATPase [Alphaproteobacteria bacterium]|nr:AAA family ATPase [Alphaproteobacteria bacterium]